LNKKFHGFIQALKNFILLVKLPYSLWKLL